MKKIDVILNSKDIRKILADYFGISEDDISILRYEYGVTGISPEEVEKKLANKP